MRFLIRPPVRDTDTDTEPLPASTVLDRAAAGAAAADDDDAAAAGAAAVAATLLAGAAAVAATLLIPFFLPEVAAGSTAAAAGSTGAISIWSSSSLSGCSPGVKTWSSERWRQDGSPSSQSMVYMYAGGFPSAASLSLCTDTIVEGYVWPSRNIDITRSPIRRERETGGLTLGAPASAAAAEGCGSCPSRCIDAPSSSKLSGLHTKLLSACRLRANSARTR